MLVFTDYYQKIIIKIFHKFKKDLKIKIQDTEINNVYLLIAGPVPFNPSELLGTANIDLLLELLKKEFDIIISKDIFQFPSLFAAKICPEKTILWTEAAAHKRLLFKLPSKFWHSIIFKPYFNKVNAIVAQSEPAKIFTKKY